MLKAKDKHNKLTIFSVLCWWFSDDLQLLEGFKKLFEMFKFTFSKTQDQYVHMENP